MDAFLSVEGVSKHYGAVAAVDRADLTLTQGRLLALLGPSGCGKTTLLRLIAGLIVADEGSIRLNGVTLNGPGVYLPPERRKVAVVFQDFALFPHMNVGANIAFGLPKGRNKRTRVPELLKLVGLEGLEKRMPHQLSGGQQQRVAIARALAAEPQLMLLDEPFSNLDPSIRRSVRNEVRQLIDDVGVTAVFVTHDQEEALSLAHEVAVMMEGRILQTGTPEQIYTRPAGRAVAEFVGDANVLPAEVRDGVAESALGHHQVDAAFAGPADLLVRAEALGVEPDAGGGGEVEGIEYFGHDQLLTVRLGDGARLKVRGPADGRVALRERVRIQVTGTVQAFPR